MRRNHNDYGLDAARRQFQSHKFQLTEDDELTAAAQGASPSIFFRLAFGAIANFGIFTGLWLVVTVLQWQSGAFTAAFGWEADEPSHYVTGVMIRDYIQAGFPRHPVAFAEDFYLHYPRVAFGLWPPLLHLAYGAWMFLFGDHRQSVLTLLGFITTSWAYIVFRMLRTQFRFLPSLAGALLLISLPDVQTSSMAVMLDTGVALTVLIAMIQYGRYLDTESNRDALLFGVCAGAAALAKYNGLMLAMLPLLCVLLTGRYYLLRVTSFWLPAIVVPLIAGPWYVPMRRLIVYAAEPGVPMNYWHAGFRNGIDIATLGGPLLFGAAIAGSIYAIRNSRLTTWIDTAFQSRTNLHIAAAATLAASWLFHSVVYPISGARYHLPAAVSLILLALVALYALIGALRKFSRGFSARGLELAALGMLLVPYVAYTFHVPQKNTHDLVKVADRVLAAPLPANSVILIAADPISEGTFVSEIAMRGPRSRYFVVRSSKILARQTLMLQEYRSLFSDGAQIMEVLDRIPVSMVVIDDSTRQNVETHRVLIAKSVQEFPDRWELIDSVSKQTGDQIRIYKLKGNEQKSLNRLSIDMGPTLGRSIGMDAYGEGRPSRDP